MVSLTAYQIRSLWYLPFFQLLMLPASSFLWLYDNILFCAFSPYLIKFQRNFFPFLDVYMSHDLFFPAQMPWELHLLLIWTNLVFTWDAWNQAKFSLSCEPLKLFKMFLFYVLYREYFMILILVSVKYDRNHKWYEPEWWKFGDKKS